MTIEPPPTADATRLTEPWRTSPTAQTPGVLVSAGRGALAGGVPAAHHEDALARYRLGLDRAGTVEHPGASERFQLGDPQPPVGHAGGDDHGAAPDLAAVLQARHVHALAGGQRGGRVAVD